ncbi:unnamed protein product [Arctia plantaginis]|uniref:Uncharacterized protein n=1 Tax=Arctia plantaginis TaxID=874455 RepID=A0A8S1AJT9_ARCPL|nr:unnamed protein product [Arctia plantaginis]
MPNDPATQTPSGHQDNITRRKKTTTTDDPDYSQIDAPVTSRIVTNNVQREVKELMKHLNEPLANYVNKELKTIKDEIVQVKESMTFINNQYEEMRAGLAERNSQIHDIEKENEELKNAVKDLTTKVNLMEQHSRSCNVEIQCVPEFKSENLVSTVMNISKVISFELTESNIHNTTRIAKQNPTSTRPKSIIVQFSSPKIRDGFLAASIKFNKSKSNDNSKKLNSSLIGIAGKKESIYITEHLSPGNKAIHAAARKRGKELSYKRHTFQHRQTSQTTSLRDFFY